MSSLRSLLEALQGAKPLRRVAGLTALFAVLALPAGLIWNVQMLLGTVLMGYTEGVGDFLGLLLLNVPAGCLLTSLGFWLIRRLTTETDRFAVPCYAILTSAYALLVVHARELATKPPDSPAARFGMLAGMIIIGLLCLKVARTHPAPRIAGEPAANPASLS